MNDAHTFLNAQNGVLVSPTTGDHVLHLCQPVILTLGHKGVLTLTNMEGELLGTGQVYRNKKRFSSSPDLKGAIKCDRVVTYSLAGWKKVHPDGNVSYSVSVDIPFDDEDLDIPPGEDDLSG